MQDRIVLITGSTDGIGKETARQLAALGATVLVHGRNAARCQTTVDEIRQATGNPQVDYLVADLASQRQVRQMAADVLARYDRLHVLINNAGVILLQRQVTEDGLEASFAVNHLAPFLLTNLLLDRIQQSAPARIVNVSSMVHYDARIDLDDLQSARRYNGVVAYKSAKLGNVLFTLELAERLQGSDVTANCLHPGAVTTKLLDTGWGWTGIPVSQGAVLPVYLASSPDVAGVTGKYYERITPESASPLAYNAQLRRKFWDASAALVGL